MKSGLLLYFFGVSSLAALLGFPLIWLYQHIHVFGNRDCNIQQLESIPTNSILIAGHIYREELNENELFDPRLERLIQLNSDKLEMVILTGDIFETSTQKRWAQLKSYFANFDLKLFIAPGNHDVEYGPSHFRDAFKTEFPNPYVQVIKHKILMIIEDTTQSNGLFAPEILNLVKEENLKRGAQEITYIFRHHVAVQGMFGNSTKGLTVEPETIFRVQPLFSNRTVIVSGDGGAGHLPRLQCTKFKNLTFIVNGLGLSDDDVVLILNDDQIWTYPVKQYSN